MAEQRIVSNLDSLSLSSNKEIKKMLLRFGDNYPTQEQIVSSQSIIKINRELKQQSRTFLITSKAIYNVKPKRWGKYDTKPQRRISLHHIRAIILSESSNQFIISPFEVYNTVPQKKTLTPPKIGQKSDYEFIFWSKKVCQI